MEAWQKNDVTGHDLWSNAFYNNAGGTTFIYTGKLYTGPASYTHRRLLEQKWPEIKADLGLETNDPDIARYALDNDDLALLGRIGPYQDGQLISFWNARKASYNKLLKPCLEKLKEIGFIEDHTVMTSPLGQTTVGKELHGDLPQATKTDWAAIRKLHLMQGQEKQATLRRMGAAVTPMRQSNRWGTSENSF